MSAAEHMMDHEHSDSRRLLAAFLAAVLLHIVLFIAFAIVRLTESAANLAPVSVELIPGTLSGPALAGPPSLSIGQPQSARSGAAQPRAASEPGFVIPTPRQGAGTEQTQPSGPAFRTAGPSQGGAQAGNFRQAGSAQQATSPVQEPVLPHATTTRQGAGAVTGGGGSSSGTSTGAPAKGVLVEGGGQAAAKGSLDLGSLDKSFANAQGSGGQPGGESGGGGGGGGTGVGSGGGGQGDLRFQWDQPAAGQARKLLTSLRPRIPEWVSKQGLSLTVLVTFTLTPDGILRDVNIEASSGYNEVDAAVVEAVRLWRFNADPSSRNIHGVIPYTIRAR